MARIALDYIPAQASSVAAEFLFSSSSQTADVRRTRIGSQLFEELQITKEQWKRDVVDFARLNDESVETIDLTPYEDLLAEDVREALLDKYLPESMVMDLTV